MDASPKRLCLFGGTFDPPHIGHLVLAECVHERYGFDAITFLPAGDPPLKASPTTLAKHRVGMLRAAIADNAHFTIDERETKRAGKSFTALTIREYRAEFPEAELCFVLGADQVAKLQDWEDAAFLLQEVRFIPALRPPFTQTLWNQLARTLGAEKAAQLQADAVAMPQLELSSTELRERAARGRTLRYLVPEGVRAYLLQHQIYTPD